MKPFGMKYRKNNPLPGAYLFSVNLGPSIEDEVEFITSYLFEGTGYKLPIKALQGRYDGKDEQAYLIEHDDSIAFLFSAMLDLMRETRQVELYYLRASTDVLPHRVVMGLTCKDAFKKPYHVGILKPCTQSQAYRQSGFTLDANTGQHYYIDTE